MGPPHLDSPDGQRGLLCAKAELASCPSVMTVRDTRRPSPRAVETSQAHRAPGRNDAGKDVFECSGSQKFSVSQLIETI